MSQPSMRIIIIGIIGIVLIGVGIFFRQNIQLRLRGGDNVSETLSWTSVMSSWAQFVPKESIESHLSKIISLIHKAKTEQELNNPELQALTKELKEKIPTLPVNSPVNTGDLYAVHLSGNPIIWGYKFGNIFTSTSATLIPSINPGSLEYYYYDIYKNGGNVNDAKAGTLKISNDGQLSLVIRTFLMNRRRHLSQLYPAVIKQKVGILKYTMDRLVLASGRAEEKRLSIPEDDQYRNFFVAWHDMLRYEKSILETQYMKEEFQKNTQIREYSQRVQDWTNTVKNYTSGSITEYIQEGDKLIEESKKIHGIQTIVQYPYLINSVLSLIQDSPSHKTTRAFNYLNKSPVNSWKEIFFPHKNFFLGVAFIANGEYKKAYDVLQEAKRNEPFNNLVRLYSVWTYSKLKNNGENVFIWSPISPDITLKK